MYRVVQEQIKLRENALQQAAQLMEYKRVLCQSDGFFAILVSLLAAPMSKTRRTEQEHLSIEIVLHLFRNVLAAQPVLRDDEAAVVHHQLVQVFERELVLDIICVMAADLDQPNSPNAAYNLLLMEILQHLVLPFKVEHVLAAANDPYTDQPDDTDKNTSKTKKNASKKSYLPTGGTGSLRSNLLRERQSAQAMVAPRHGNFGGSLVLGDKQHDDQTVAPSKDKPTNWTVSTTKFVQSALGRTNNAGGATVHSKRRAPVFVGALPSRMASVAPTPAARQACAVVARFGKRFLADCFAPWAKSLKNEFRRDSVRLEDGDRVVWLQLVAYWSKFWRGLKVKPDKKNKSVIGPLIFAMDVFSFHLVHNAADTFIQHKDYGKLAHSIGLLKEMMLLLQILYNSSDETEQIMAMGLLDRLFYGSEPLDRLPKLLSLWQPGQASHQYAADLAELVHTQIKLLEKHADACAELADPEAQKKPRKKKKDSGVMDTIIKMKMAAADFDVSSYVRKLATPHNVSFYTQLLSQYTVNGIRLNHRIVTFLLRIAQFKIVVPEYSEEEGAPKNPLANTKVITLEPMLYNVRLLWVLHSVLNDAAAVKDTHLETVVQFAVRMVSRFAAAAKENPLLLVEALVKHTSVHRHCEAVMTHYVSEELVMLAERDLLLEEQENWEEQFQGEEDDDDGDNKERPRLGGRHPRPHEDSDSDGEVEFDGELVQAVPSASKGSSKRKAILEDSDDELEDNGEEKEPSPESPAKKQRTIDDNGDGNDADPDADDEKKSESVEENTEWPSPKKQPSVNDEPEDKKDTNGDQTAESSLETQPVGENDSVKGNERDDDPVDTAGQSKPHETVQDSDSEDSVEPSSPLKPSEVENGTQGDHNKVDRETSELLDSDSE